MTPAATSTIDGLVHRATERLAVIPEGGVRAEQLEALRRFLRLETERLRMRHRVGLGGDEVAAGRSQQVDLAVRRISQLVAAEFSPAAQQELAAVALVALGGYGRSDLAPYSDVDLLYLHDARDSEVVREFVARTLALLWDTGFTVGHSFRSVDECVSSARHDLHSRTSMVEARLVAGDAELFARFQRRLDEAVFRSRRDAEAFVEALRAETEARYAKYGRSVGLLEPNVKESAGGLRDLHTILWLGHARLGTRGLEELRDGRHLGEGEYAALRRARAFLARVRNEAHFATGRKTDLLALDLQPTLAENLAYVNWRGVAPSERLMRDYYLRAHELHHVFEGFAVRHGLHDRPRPLRLRLPLRRQHPLFEAHDGALLVRRGRADLGHDPQVPLEAFALAQEQDLALSEGVRVAIRATLRDVDARFRASREASRVFLRIVGRRGRVAPVLRAMHDTGFLGRYLPELARITFLVQHDHYHHYTVDEHTLRAIEALDEVALSRERRGALAPFRRALDELEDVTPLYLALLLHDIGKGRAGSHVPAGARLAERICARLKLARPQAEEVVFLVRSHLLMSQLSQRRDLTEEGLVRGFAEQLGGLERLNALLLLTYADHCGVGPGVWTAWKSALLWDLYGRARTVLTGRPVRLEGDASQRARAGLVEALAGRFAASEVERHLALLPERYLRAVSTEEIGTHLDLAARLAVRPLIVGWQKKGDGVHTALTICTRDAPGVFARLAGTLSASGLDIKNVEAYTREDGVVLDTFVVSGAMGQELDAARCPGIEADLVAAVEGRLDVVAAMEEWRRRAAGRTRTPQRSARRPTRPTVRFDDGASPTATVIDVGADDEHGLLFRIAGTLAGLGLDISFAKIASEKSRAWDVFYVTDASGRKLTADERTVVERGLLAALGGAGERRSEGVGR